MKVELRIVAAAYLLPDGKIIVGDDLDHMTADMAAKEKHNQQVNEDMAGYVDSIGNFRDRRSAFLIALEAGQIYEDEQHQSELYDGMWSYEPL